jgi:hypothetical protein
MTDAEISAMMLSLTMGVTYMPHDKKRTPASDMNFTIKAVSE